MTEGRAALCARCGAPLALAAGGQAHCVYCLHRQPLPADVQTALATSEALSLELDQATRALARTGRSHYLLWVLLGINLPGVLIAGAAVFAAVATQESTEATLMFATLGFGGLLPFIAVPIAWIRIRSRSRLVALARLPLSVPVVAPAGLSSVCPQCGAPHPPSAGRLTSVCGHCRTEALLPLPIVGARLARQHQEVVNLRLQQGVEGQSRMLAVQIWQREIVPWVFGFCVLFGIVFVAFRVIAEIGAR